MTRERIIPDAVRAVQTEASNPEVSAFVAANAGSGKTHVLAQRVIRLLLAGNDPARILCLTFTKAAAAKIAAEDGIVLNMTDPVSWPAQPALAETAAESAGPETRPAAKASGPGTDTWPLPS